ncbi:MAG: putative rane protein [Herbinix sp.]|jgi:tight adherence protein B|nr:putative rane protein [Herbinix sp.]
MIRNGWEEIGTTQYDSYRFTGWEKLRYLLQGILIITLIGYFFYKHMGVILMMTPLVYYYLKSKRRCLIRERKWKLNLEFRDGILALSAALEAGYSAENAIEEARKDLLHIYHESAMIVQEFNYMINQLRMNVTVEKVMEDFAIRSQVEDILSFSEVFSTAKRSGGELISVIKLTGNIISDKIEVKREIITLITAKRMEANIMKGIPLLILAYLTFSSPGFLDPLYHNAFGVIVMTVLLLMYLVANLVIERIIAIEV